MDGWRSSGRKGGSGSGPYFLAWGYVEYKEPLTDKQIKDYELTE